ncbi:Gfo/Idh/MocA family oxidoreductase [Vibrio breoganii]
MRSVLVIGAGQLGSRHIESLVGLDGVNIIAYDPSVESIKRVQQHISNLGKHADNIHYTSNFPRNGEFDFVVVATNSDVRLAVIEELLEFNKVGFLILEKVLFSNVEDLEKADRAIKKHGIRCYVNCPLRAFQFFKDLKLKSNPEKTLRSVEVKGTNWGLACNSIHFIDLVEFLTAAKIQRVDFKEVDSALIESKRTGFSEFLGKISLEYSNGTSISLECQTGDAFQRGIKFVFDSYTVSIDETTGTVTVQGKELDFENYKPEYQSTLTARYFNESLSGEIKSLPSFEISYSQHKALLDSMESHFGKKIQIT